jgi:cytochrome P450
VFKSGVYIGLIGATLNILFNFLYKPIDKDTSYKTKFKTGEFDPFSLENLQNPYSFYKALRDEAPVFEMKRGSDSYFVISRYADIKTVCKDTEVYGSNIVNILLDAGNG